MTHNLTNYKLIFVHGYTASSQVNWYPTLKPMLDKLGVDYSIPDLPGGKQPHSQKWLELIHQEVLKTDKPIVLIGHSLGTRAVLLYLDQYQTKVEEVILVAPLSNDMENAKRRGGDAYPDFFEYKIDLKKVKKLAKKWTILHSKDDYSLDYEQHGVALSKEMEVKLITFENRSHFTKAEDAEAVFGVLKNEI
jgi:predicted alpha/beta hydrolase family esterase